MRRTLLLLFIASTSFAARAAEVPTFTTAKNWVADYLDKGGDITQVTGLKHSVDWQAGATFVDVKPLATLPATFDWRNEVAGGMQAIRNQGNCGSCWAFSITAVVESLMRINDPAGTPNLSEQTLVDCSAYNCNGGDFDAFDYVQSKGMANRTDYPYYASNRSCNVTSNMSTQKVVSWSYVGTPNTEPTTEQIKTAIMQYGPVSVDVAVIGLFSGYSSGVYNNCMTGPTNHMVTIEGWNDEGGGYWIMRNSWGADWGENGYMRIRYTDSRGRKCNQIGKTTAFAVLE